jgi:hypothetical protein
MRKINYKKESVHGIDDNEVFRKETKVNINVGSLLSLGLRIKKYKPIELLEHKF